MCVCCDIVCSTATAFVFKCHRQGDEVYAVNAINFHPNPDPVTQHVLVTAGSDGVNCFWNKHKRQRVAEYTKAVTGKCVC